MTEPIDLDAIKAAVARESANIGITPASTLLLLDAIDIAAGGDLGPEPPRIPFPIGGQVAHRELESLRGRISERKEDGGELHSVRILWATGGSDWYSPRELSEVTA